MQQEFPGLDSHQSSSTQNNADNASLEEVLKGIGNSSSEFRNCTIITPNQPLAQQLNRIRLQSLDTTSAKAGNIKVLHALLAESAISSTTYPLATETQLLFLWQIALEKTQSDFPELDAKTLAPQALSAWQDLKRYELRVDELRTAEVGQLVRFSDSVKEFETLLQRKKLSTVELEIEARISAKTDTEKAQTAYLYAFIEPPPPLFKRWLKLHFKKIDTCAYLAKPNAEGFLYTAEDGASELAAAGQWASEVLKEQRDAKVAIVHTHLGEDINRAVRLVTTELQDDIEFSLSLKPPLSNLGPIACALDLLKLNQHQLDYALARRIIQSPFWSNFESEYDQRSEWETALCHMQSRQIKPQQFVGLLSENVSEPATSLARRLLKLSDTKRRSSSKRSPLDWAELFHEQLGVLNWPGTTDHKNGDLLLEDWYDLLHEFAQLGAVSGDIDLNQALRELQRCCNRRRTSAGAAHPGVRLLDTIEGAADYTHLWVVGMSNTQWPASATPNPLLPVNLQRKKELPRSSPEHETRLAQELTHRALAAGNQVVFSYSAISDGLDQKPSSLLPALVDLQTPQLASPINVDLTSLSFEVVDTEFAPPLEESEKHVTGGASLLRAMAASPFYAFAQWRLGASALPEPKTGLDPAERGTLVHWVLDSIWNKLGSSAALAAMNETEIESLCDGIAKQELQRWQQRHGWLTQAYQDLEVARLSRLAQRWLQLEAERSPFKVRESETHLEAKLGALHFNLRLDRLDELENGSLILIDYKTGQNISKENWLELPPAEPQLPLYAISLDEQPSAICFAQLRPDQMRMAGIGQQAYESGFYEIDHWDELIELWRSSLSALAAEYESGLARVDETDSGFNRADPFASLHRMSEYDQLTEWLEQKYD